MLASRPPEAEHRIVQSLGELGTIGVTSQGL